LLGLNYQAKEPVEGVASVMLRDISKTVFANNPVNVSVIK